MHTNMAQNNRLNSSNRIINHLQWRGLPVLFDPNGYLPNHENTKIVASQPLLQAANIKAPSPPGYGMDCAICGQRSHGHHFGVLACRACASFFRRTVAENKTYECIRNNACDIRKEGMRNVCRACRLRRCHECGMRKEDIEQQNNNGSTNAAQSVQNSSAKMSLISFSSNPLQNAAELSEQMPLLSRILRGYECFINAQKSLSIVDNPKSLFQEQKSRVPTKEDIIKMDHHSMSLLYTMLNDYMESFAQLEHTNKVTLLQACWTQTMLLHRCYLSISMHPDVNDTAFVISHGFTMRAENLEEMLRESAVMHGIVVEEYVNMKRPIMEKSMALCKKFKKLKCRQLDILALMTIVVWFEAERLDIMSEEMAAHKRSCLIEWHSNLISVWGLDEGGFRLAQLMCLLVDVNQVTANIKEVLMLFKLFAPQIFEPTVTQGLFKSDCEYD
uniref:Uncharacterized protein n=1 Tax=Ditylenchus dipsaci TaxID=166011 RepID=A0A915DF02_9BILA